MTRQRTILAVEQLECRLVPTMVATYVGGSLYLRGTPNAELDIIRTAGSNFQVKDGANLIGNFNILGNLSVSLASRKADVKIDVNGGVIPGNVSLDLGAGYLGAGAPGSYAASLYDTAGGGRVGGSVTLLNGNGSETFNVGAVGDPSSGVTTHAITISGDLTVAAKRSNIGQGDMLLVDAGTTIFGNFSATFVDVVNLGSPNPGAPLTTVAKNVAISNASALTPLQVVATGVIGGSFTVTGTSLDDNINLEQDTAGGGLVKGTVSINAGDGQTHGDKIRFGANAEVVGKATVSGGSNLGTPFGDQFMIFGNFDAALNVLMGGNVNSLYFRPENGGDPQPIVAGNFTISAGNGNNNIGNSITGAFQGTVLGNLSFTLGSGNNGAAGDPIVIVTNLMNALYWKSGSGKDFVQLGDNASSGNTYNYLVNMVFGSNDDSLTLDLGVLGFLNGLADGGAGNNTLHITSGTIVPAATIANWTIV